MNLDIPDNGEHTILPSTLEIFKPDSVDLTKDCKLDITITRTSTGQTNPSFVTGSRIIATQYRSVKQVLIDN